MSERITERQVCSHCKSLRTGPAGMVGHREVWRCSDCSRTFWPRKKRSSVILRLKHLLVGETGN